MRRGKGESRIPDLKPVENIELSEKGIPKRAIIAVTLLFVGLAFLGYSVYNWLSRDNGWTRIEPTQIVAESASSDLTLLYELGVSNMAATAEYKAVSALYTQLCADAFRIFHADYGYENVHNPYYINRNIGREIEVDSALYRAFEQIEQLGSRFLFAAPFYTEYRNMFTDTEDHSASDLDPYRSESVAEYFSELSVFTSSEEHVKLELLGDNKVKLLVSDEFKSFADKNGIDTFIDFFWAKNAFIVDYIADSLVAEGYVFGSISSVDGFMRTFDTRDISFTHELIARVGKNAYKAGKLEYKGKNSIVFLRSFKLYETDMIYYRYEDGTERHAYVDENDGLCKNALDTLTSYSRDKSCGEVLLSVMPVYIENAFDSEKLTSLVGEGVYSIYSEGTVLCYNEDAAVIKDLYDDGKTEFTASLVK